MASTTPQRAVQTATRIQLSRANRRKPSASKRESGWWWMRYCTSGIVLQPHASSSRFMPWSQAVLPRADPEPAVGLAPGDGQARLELDVEREARGARLRRPALAPGRRV